MAICLIFGGLEKPSVFEGLNGVVVVHVKANG